MRQVKPPRPAGQPAAHWTQKMKPRDWVEVVIGAIMLVVAFLGVTRLLSMPWWGVVLLSLGYVVLVGGVMVRVRSR
jgi:hypothetical protein